jgi:pyruvate,water dikinase
MRLNALFKHWSYRIFAPGVLLRGKYEAFKQLLHFDDRCHEQMAGLQELLFTRQPADYARVRSLFANLSKQVLGMVESLETMVPGKYVTLKSYHKKFDFYTRYLLAPPDIDFSPPFVLPLTDIAPDADRIGGKGKNIAILGSALQLQVPRGYAVTTSGYHYFIEYNNLRKPIEELLAQLDISVVDSLNEVSVQLMQLIRQATLPPELEEAMLAAYDSWGKAGLEEGAVAVRSSGIGEDGRLSFAGQYDTLLGVTRKDIGQAYCEVIASKYSPQALYYRVIHGLGDEETAMSVLIQEMVLARCSGVIYTGSVQQNEATQENLHLHVVEGFGESLVGGAAVPDTYVLSRATQPVLLEKAVQENLLSASQVLELAGQAMRVEQYFKKPQDIEWAMDQNGELFFLQSRALQLVSEKEKAGEGQNLETLSLPVLLEGECASSGVATGLAHHLCDQRELESVPEGAILLTRNTPPHYLPLLGRVAAVLAERGSRACHFATVAREFGVPVLTGIANLLQHVASGDLLTVDGMHGKVYQGRFDDLVIKERKVPAARKYQKVLQEALGFVVPLELVDPQGENFMPEGCRSLHDIIRFCHETAVQAMFSAGRPGTGRGALRLAADLPLDVYLFDVGGGLRSGDGKDKQVALDQIDSVPFLALWRGLGHPEVQWKKKPYDWDAFDKIEMAGGIAPAKDSFALSSYAVIGADYLHFNIRFGYHFTIVDALCSEKAAENHCILRFAGGGGDFSHRSLRIDFIAGVLERLEFLVEKKGDLLEARLPALDSETLQEKLDMLGRLLGATKLMDMVLEDEQEVRSYIDAFFNGRYSFSQEG